MVVSDHEICSGNLSEITHLIGNCLLFIVAVAFSLVLGVRAPRLCLQPGWEQWEMAFIMGHIQILEMLKGGEKHTSKNG